LEVNVFTTLPILILGRKYSFIRAKVQVFMYFFFQTVGSLLLVAGFGLNRVEFVLVGLFIKLGVFPLNFWVPLVFSSLG
jgi:formate hydrogenlyase subunit 3/multisubunit Na+/H+ antiporter MnhD subunit